MKKSAKLRVCRAFWFFYMLALLGLALASGAKAQDVRLDGHNTILDRVFSDTLAGVATKVLKPTTGVGENGWFRLDGFQYFSAWFTISSDCTYFAGTGFGAADSIAISYELYTAAATPTSATNGFVEFDTGARKRLVTITAADTAATKSRFYKSFHGSGDPELAPSKYIRFYAQTYGGFSAPGLLLTFDLLKQP